MEHQGLGHAGGATVLKGACSREILAGDGEGSALCEYRIEYGFPPNGNSQGKKRLVQGGVNLYRIVVKTLRFLQAHGFLLFQEFLIILKTFL